MKVIRPWYSGLALLVGLTASWSAIALATAQTTDWDRYLSAGLRAYQEGRYPDAEQQLKAALVEAEKFAPRDSRLAESLNALAQLYAAQGKYAEAVPLVERLVAARESILGPDHPIVAAILNELAALWQNQGKYAEAEPLSKRAIAIHEKALGPNHPDLAAGLGTLAELYRAQGKYAEAEPLYKRSLAIREKALAGCGKSLIYATE